MNVLSVVSDKNLRALVLKANDLCVSLDVRTLDLVTETVRNALSLTIMPTSVVECLRQRLPEYLHSAYKAQTRDYDVTNDGVVDGVMEW